MSKTTVFAIVGVLGLAAFIFYFSWHEDSGSQDPAPEENRPSLQDVAQDSPVLQEESRSGEPEELSASGTASIGAPGPVDSSYPPEFRRILENQRPGYRYNSISALHKSFAQQARDPDWAPLAENRFREHFVNSAQLAPYGQPTVECKSTMCEVRLSTDRAGPDTDWKRIVTPPRQDPQSDSYSISAFSMATDEMDGTSSVVLIVTYDRTRPPTR